MLLSNVLKQHYPKEPSLIEMFCICTIIWDLLDMWPLGARTVTSANFIFNLKKIVI